MNGKQGRRSKQLLHDLKGETGYWKLRGETPCLELGFGEVVDLS
jgi:hypothetical protein